MSEPEIDPTACWKRFLETLGADRREESRDALYELADWLIRDGSPPEGMTKAQAHKLVGICKRGMFWACGLYRT